MPIADSVAVSRTRIRASKWNNIPHLLDGTPGFGDAVFLNQYSSASVPSLTVKNLNAAGTHLDVLGSNGVSRLKVTDAGVTIPTLAAGTGASSIQFVQTGKILGDGNGFHTSFEGTWPASSPSHPWYSGQHIDLHFDQTHNGTGSANSQVPFKLSVTDASGSPFVAGQGLISSFLVETRAEVPVPASNPAAYYNLTGAIYSTAARTNAWDQVAVAGVSWIAGTSNGRARGIYAEGRHASNAATAYALGAEITVKNAGGGVAAAYSLAGLNGKTVGLAVESGIEGASTFTSLGILISGDIANANSAFLTGINFTKFSCRDYGIDFGYMRGSDPTTGAPASFVPIRLNSGQFINFLNSAGNVNGALIGANASDDTIVTSNATNLDFCTDGTGAARKARIYNAGGMSIGSAAGAPGGGNGWLNVTGGVTLAGSNYTNPDYVFERAYSGQVVRYAASPGAAEYQPMSLRDTEAYTRSHWRLPGAFGEEVSADIFRRSDLALEKIEEIYLHLFDLDRRLTALEDAP